MMDEREDRLDETIREAAQREYHAPPPVPRAEMWERIRAARAAGARPAERPAEPARRRRWIANPVWIPLGMAALLALGIAIGRVSAPGAADTTGAPPRGLAAMGDSAPVPASTPRLGGAPAGPEGTSLRREPGQMAQAVATGQHLRRVETFLTEFSSQGPAGDFSVRARDLLNNTRLLLDSKRAPDMRVQKLLEDLELVLTQIVTLDPKDRRDLDYITDGLSQHHLWTRLRSTAATGSLIPM